MVWTPTSTWPRLLSWRYRRLRQLVVGGATAANADSMTTIKRRRSMCRHQTESSFVEPCLGDGAASRDVPCRGKYRCRNARRRAKTTSWGAGGWGTLRWARRLAHLSCRQDAGHGCAPLGADRRFTMGAQTLPDLVRHATESEAKSSRPHELCPFLFLPARYRTHRGNARPAPERSCRPAVMRRRRPAVPSSGGVGDPHLGPTRAIRLDPAAE